MYPMPPPPGSPYYRAPAPPRKHVPTWAVVLSIAAFGLCAIFGTGTLMALRLMTATNAGPALSPTLPASVGESLVINNITVTLVSAKQVNTGYNWSGQAIPGVSLSLHFWNQTGYDQSLGASWKLLADGGAQVYPASGGFVSLSPNETADNQFTVQLNVGDHGPYTLQTDFTTSQGQPLAWTFTG